MSRSVTAVHDALADREVTTSASRKPAHIEGPFSRAKVGPFVLALTHNARITLLANLLNTGVA